MPGQSNRARIRSDILCRRSQVHGCSLMKLLLLEISTWQTLLDGTQAAAQVPQRIII